MEQAKELKATEEKLADPSAVELFEQKTEEVVSYLLKRYLKERDSEKA